MGDLGRYLRELRERKGMTLEEMSQITRIGKQHLAALEAEAFAELPAPVFVKGFVRAYCEALHEHADEALARYGAMSPPALTGRPAPARRAPARARGKSALMGAATLLVVLAGGLAALQLAGRGGALTPPPGEQPVAATGEGPGAAGAAARAPEALPVPGPPATALEVRAVAPPPGAIAQRLLARATEPTWLRVQMDGGEAVQELLPAGATREWTAERRFVLTIGNAGGIQLELNGRPVPPLGGRGAVIRDLVLPRDDSAKPRS